MRYHAHIFFAEWEREAAALLGVALRAELPPEVEVGPFLPRAAGPLPGPMIQLEYPERHLAQVRGVLDSLREQRSVLIHPLLEDELLAHQVHSEWLGPPLRLRLEAL